MLACLDVIAMRAYNDLRTREDAGVKLSLREFATMVRMEKSARGEKVEAGERDEWAPLMAMVKRGG